VTCFAVINYFASGALLAPFDPGKIDLTNVLASPSMNHLFGTDQLGVMCCPG